MKLPFRILKDGSVTSRFFCDHFLQGYPGLLHGGVIAAMLDGTMTNCLFAHGKTAVTASLTVRFLHPVTADQTATLRARIKRSNPPLHLMEAELLQGKKIVAQATAKFMECPENFFQKHIPSGLKSSGK
jgi:uncharacterized protein (TIGR00369 family)